MSDYTALVTALNKIRNRLAWTLNTEDHAVIREAIEAIAALATPAAGWSDVPTKRPVVDLVLDPPPADPIRAWADRLADDSIAIGERPDERPAPPADRAGAEETVAHSSHPLCKLVGTHLIAQCALYNADRAAAAPAPEGPTAEPASIEFAGEANKTGTSAGLKGWWNVTGLTGQAAGVELLCDGSIRGVGSEGRPFTAVWEAAAQAPEGLEWAIQRVEVLAACFRTNAGRYGEKLLKGHGYPNEVMSEAQDALALETVLAAVRARPVLSDETLREMAEDYMAKNGSILRGRLSENALMAFARIVLEK